MDNLINFTPLIEIFMGFITAAITGVLVFLSNYLRKKWGIDLDLAHNQMLQEAIEAAAEYAIAALPGKIEVDNDLIEKAADYLISYAPKVLSHFGYDRETVRKMVESALGQRLLDNNGAMGFKDK